MPLETNTKFIFSSINHVSGLLLFCSHPALSPSTDKEHSAAVTDARGEQSSWGCWQDSQGLSELLLWVIHGQPCRASSPGCSSATAGAPPLPAPSAAVLPRPASKQSASTVWGWGEGWDITKWLSSSSCGLPPGLLTAPGVLPLLGGMLGAPAPQTLGNSSSGTPFKDESQSF